MAALARREIVVFPTESVYGMGVDALDGDAVDRLVALRGRAADKPILVLVSDLAMATATVADRVPAPVRRLTEHLWPGPLTVVVPARAGLPRHLTAGTGTIGVRASAHPMAAALVVRHGGPVTAPSANPPGREPARRIEQARAYFGAGVACYLDGGTCPGGASTVVTVEQDRIHVVRPGPIGEAALRAAMGE